MGEPQGHEDNSTIMLLLKIASTVSIFLIGAGFSALPVFVEKFR